MRRRIGMRAAAATGTALALALATSAHAQSTPQAAIDDLVDASHILFSQGVLDGFGHVSARVPGNPQRFYMARARAPSEVAPEDIIELDLDGNPTGGPARGKVVFRELHIHAAVYRARSDVNGVVHSHTHSEPYPSPTDVAQAPDPTWHYVIVSLKRDAPEVRSYRIVDGTITEEPVNIVEQY